MSIQGKRKAKPKIPKKPEPNRVKCPDCGSEYNKDAPHFMFCKAKTCEICQETFDYVLPDGQCEKCLGNEKEGDFFDD